MIFSLQHYIEDYFHRRNLSDVDQYAVRVANCFVDRMEETDDQLLKSVHRIRTIFFQNNSHLNRQEFEANLASMLRSRFKKKRETRAFPGGVETERRLLRRHKRLTIQSIIKGFAQAVEARAVGAFWQSRKKAKLIRHAEKIGQSLFALYAKGVLSERDSGLILREVSSGIGFVDVAIGLGATLHLIEMKVVRSTFTGASQLGTYMHTENRTRGWLVCFDARHASRRNSIPPSIATPSGVVAVVGIDINPRAPSDRQKGSSKVGQ